MCVINDALIWVTECNWCKCSLLLRQFGLATYETHSYFTIYKQIRVFKKSSISYLSLLSRFDENFTIYTYFTHITASSTVTERFGNKNGHA